MAEDVRAVVVGAVLVSEVEMGDVEDDVDVEWLAVGVVALVLLVEDEALAVVCAAVDAIDVVVVAFKAPNGDTGAHDALGV